MCQKRDQDYAIFRSIADKVFRAPKARNGMGDERHYAMTARHGYYLAPNGRCKQNRPSRWGEDVFEVFYGGRQVPSHRVALLDRENAPETLTEAGASLVYTRGEDGTVTVWLYPARTDAVAAEEDAIQLAHYTDTAPLTGKGTLEDHLSALRSYAEVTSLDGAPSLGDLAKVAWMRMSKPVVENGRRRAAELWDYAKVVGAVALGVVAAGAVL
ncbi:MAG: hypothetical protein MRY63_00390 [Neomegalonema sp.]|nr:hypothetical protein [Neomegalonema sp.]